MTLRSWNDIQLSLNNPHLLQSSQWAELKGRYGWTAHYLVWHQPGDHLELIYSSEGDLDVTNVRAAALVLERKALTGISVMYIPKGPTLDDWDDYQLADQVISDLGDFARGFEVIQLKIDPDLILGWGEPGTEEERNHPAGELTKQNLKNLGWRFSAEQIQFRNTILVDLLRDEEKILGDMKSKTRYNIRLSERKGIQVRRGDRSDLKKLYRMYADTSLRGNFTIRDADYYQSLWGGFLDQDLDPDLDPQAQPLIAEYKGQAVAGAVIFKFGSRAWYLHGMSLPEHSEKMAPHLIQWEAICWAKSAGCDVYDMWGAPDDFNPDDPLWGVYRFKTGYGGELTRTIGAWDYPSRPILYFLYNRLLPRILDLMRWFGHRKTRDAAGEDS